MTRSAVIYHGPGACQVVIDEAGRQGRLLHEPFGDKGLKIKEAREAVRLLQSVPIGLDLGLVIVGPLDKAPPRSVDVLLKVVEEFNQYVRPLLWAYDLGGVRPTIRSRCLDVWCPATGYEPEDEVLDEVARELLHASLGERYYEVPGLVAQMSGREAELLAEVVNAMSVLLDNPKVLPLWERVRGAARWRNPTAMEVISAFLPES